MMLLHYSHFPGVSRWEKTNKYEIVRTVVSYQPAKETVLSSCDTIPRHLQPNNTRGIHGITCTLKKTKREKKEERKEKKKSGKNEANMRSRRRSSREDKVAVCWYDQSY